MTLYSPYSQEAVLLHDLQSQEYFISKIRKQKEKVELLASQFQDQEALIERQQEQIRVLNLANQTLQQESLVYTETNQRLSIMHQQLLHEIESQQRVIHQLEAKLNYVLSEASTVRETWERDRQQLREMQHTSHEVQLRSKNTVEQLKQEVKDLGAEIGTIRSRQDEKCQQMEEMRGCLEMASATISTLQSECRKAQRSLDSYESQMNNREDIHEQDLLRMSKELQQAKLQANNHKKVLWETNHSNQKRLKELQQSTASKNKKWQCELLSFSARVRQLQQDILYKQDMICQLGTQLQEHRKIQGIKRHLLQRREQQSNQLDVIISGLKLKAK